MKETTISEVDILCPYCGKERATVIDTDEIEFNPDGTGHYYADVSCFNCGRTHRKYWHFKYEITREATRS